MEKKSITVKIITFYFTISEHIHQVYKLLIIKMIVNHIYLYSVTEETN